MPPRHPHEVEYSVSREGSWRAYPSRCSEIQPRPSPPLSDPPFPAHSSSLIWALLKLEVPFNLKMGSAWGLGSERSLARAGLQAPGHFGHWKPAPRSPSHPSTSKWIPTSMQLARSLRDTARGRSSRPASSLRAGGGTGLEPASPSHFRPDQHNTGVRHPFSLGTRRLL